MKNFSNSSGKPRGLGLTWRPPAGDGASGRERSSRGFLGAGRFRVAKALERAGAAPVWGQLTLAWTTRAACVINTGPLGPRQSTQTLADVRYVNSYLGNVIMASFFKVTSSFIFRRRSAGGSTLILPALSSFRRTSR
jgi:hypothetical protein